MAGLWLLSGVELLNVPKACFLVDGFAEALERGRHHDARGFFIVINVGYYRWTFGLLSLNFVSIFDLWGWSIHLWHSPFSEWGLLHICRLICFDRLFLLAITKWKLSSLFEAWMETPFTGMLWHLSSSRWWWVHLNSLHRFLVLNRVDLGHQVGHLLRLESGMSIYRNRLVQAFAILDLIWLE